MNRYHEWMVMKDLFNASETVNHLTFALNTCTSRLPSPFTLVNRRLFHTAGQPYFFCYCIEDYRLSLEILTVGHYNNYECRYSSSDLSGRSYRRCICLQAAHCRFLCFDR